LVIRDLGSTNGVRINGERVVEGHLRAGDELTIGNHRYEVRWDGSANAEPKAVRREGPSPGPESKKRQAEVSFDASLESCDDPVPLKEPPSGARSVSKGRNHIKKLPPSAVKP
jgi:pSer/pThr/pTyr-binding forkhead associated (FHA) protein